MGIIASFAYWRYEGQAGLGLKHPASPLPFRELTRSLSLGPEQHQIVRSLLPAHQQRIGELRLGLAKQRQELFEMLKEEAPSWPAMQDKIKAISDLQGKLETEMVQFYLDFRHCLKLGTKNPIHGIYGTSLGHRPGRQRPDSRSSGPPGPIGGASQGD